MFAGGLDATDELKVGSLQQLKAGGQSTHSFKRESRLALARQMQPR